MSSRRDFLKYTSNGFGMLALASMLTEETAAARKDRPAGPHHPPRAKNVIFCFMDGGPSHVDSFDYKPELARQQGKAIGEEGVSKLSQSTPGRVWFGSPWKFQQRGESGLWVSDLFPHLAEIADDLCVVHSMRGIQPLHGQQALLLHAAARA